MAIRLDPTAHPPTPPRTDDALTLAQLPWVVVIRATVEDPEEQLRLERRVAMLAQAIRAAGRR